MYGHVVKGLMVLEQSLQLVLIFYLVLRNNKVDYDQTLKDHSMTEIKCPEHKETDEVVDLLQVSLAIEWEGTKKCINLHAIEGGTCTLPTPLIKIN